MPFSSSHSSYGAGGVRRAIGVSSPLTTAVVCIAIASAWPVAAATLAPAASASSPQDARPALEGRRYYVGGSLASRSVARPAGSPTQTRITWVSYIQPAFPGVQSIGIRYRGSRTGNTNLALLVTSETLSTKQGGGLSVGAPSTSVVPFVLPIQNDDRWHTLSLPVTLGQLGNTVSIALDKDQAPTNASIDYLWLTSGSADNDGVATRRPSPYNLEGTGVIWKPEMVVVRADDGASLTNVKPCAGCGLSMTFNAAAPKSAAALQSVVVGSIINSDLDHSLGGPVFTVSKVVSKSASTITVEGTLSPMLDVIESGELSLGTIAGPGGISAQQAIDDAFAGAASQPPLQVSSLQPKRQFALAMDALRQGALPSFGLQDLIRPAQAEGAYDYKKPTFSIGPVSDKNGVGFQVSSLKFGIGSDCDLGKLAGELPGVELKDKAGNATRAGKFLGYESSDIRKSDENVKDAFAQCAAAKLDGTINKLLVQAKLDVSHLKVHASPVPQAIPTFPYFVPSWDVEGTMSVSPNLALDATTSASLAAVREFAATYEQGFRFVVPPSVPVFGTVQISEKLGLDVSAQIAKFSLKATHTGTAVGDFDNHTLNYHAGAGTFKPELLLAGEASASAYVGMGVSLSLGKVEDKYTDGIKAALSDLPKASQTAILNSLKGAVRIAVAPKLTLLKATVARAKDASDAKTPTFAVSTGVAASLKADSPVINAFYPGGLNPVNASIDLGSLPLISMGCNYLAITSEKVQEKYKWSVHETYAYPNCRDLLENPL